jgi:hypothetical protein
MTGGRWLFVDALLVTLLVDVALLVDAFAIRFHFAHRTETDQIVVILAKVT